MTSRRFASARARRAAGLGLASVLILLSVAATVASFEQARLARRASAAAEATDRYQDVRYLAMVQHAAHEEALGESDDPAARRAHLAAADEFSAMLIELRGADPAHAAQLTSMIESQARYASLAVLFFDLVAAGRTNEAELVHHTRMQPVENQIVAEIDRLTAYHRDENAAAYRDLQRNARAVQLGTPVAVGAGLLLIALFGLVSRSYRRTVEKHASHDPLTGLPNRMLLQQRCDQALADAGRAGGQPVVLLLDLDDFKQVNDTLGHHAGDQLLIAVAGRLREATRDGDTVARLGGDEFAILLTGGGSAAGERLAERITEALSRSITIDGMALGVEASIGIAVADPESDVQTLIRHADSAMYLAKRLHLSHAHYAAEHDHNNVVRLTLLDELRRALREDEFVLRYQPKVAVGSGEPVGIEALARWQHPTRGLLTPDEFIPTVDTSNLAVPFAVHVVAKALEHARTWLQRGRHLPVAVNISARCLLDQQWPETIAALLAAADVPAGTLCLEITESSIMADPEQALRALTRLRQVGVHASIDDFGTGYSSMSYLKLLPVDELKIDRSFVAGVAHDPKNRMLVRSAIDLGHNFGLAVVAEGIEDEPTLAMLHDLGCDIAQGYLVARPLTPEALVSWLAGRDGAVLPEDRRAAVPPATAA